MKNQKNTSHFQSLALTSSKANGALPIPESFISEVQVCVCMCVRVCVCVYGAEKA